MKLGDPLAPYAWMDEAVIRATQYVYDLCLDIAGVQVGSFRIAVSAAPMIVALAIGAADFIQGFKAIGMCYLVFYAVLMPFFMINLLTFNEQMAHNQEQSRGHYNKINYLALYVRQKHAIRLLFIIGGCMSWAVVPLVVPWCATLYAGAISICVMVRDRDGDRFARGRKLSAPRPA